MNNNRGANWNTQGLVTPTNNFDHSWLDNDWSMVDMRQDQVLPQLNYAKRIILPTGIWSTRSTTQELDVVNHHWSRNCGFKPPTTTLLNSHNSQQTEREEINNNLLDDADDNADTDKDPDADVDAGTNENENLDEGHPGLAYEAAGSGARGRYLTTVPGSAGFGLSSSGTAFQDLHQVWRMQELQSRFKYFFETVIEVGFEDPLQLAINSNGSFLWTGGPPLTSNFEYCAADSPPVSEQNFQAQMTDALHPKLKADLIVLRCGLDDSRRLTRC
ncbi:hypothetical protein D9757_010265 [Collybiopsis confluens]|uniref:Uncharacterized protein n=1 Tax=Collybiopsis confluens TaxID=2823264 RepID=A0A8H5HB43_9AGAR|nr:hypothetical protein D9757_010265 [Collybiopsis confluens]